jgi:Hemerythrin HHE cation binding domain
MSEEPPIPPVSGARPTENFRRQHAELQALGAEIARQLTIKNLETNAAHVRRLMAQFAGKLAMHAKMENDALYPRLLAHLDVDVQRRARMLLDEVRHIYGVFGKYERRWPDAAAIANNSAVFVRETLDVLRLLGRRMAREDEELYPLADSAA